MSFTNFIHKNQFLITERNGKRISFKSYDSMCAVVDTDKNTITLGCDWDYSTTTLRHLYRFLEMFTVVEHRKGYIEKCIKEGKLGSFELKYDDGLR